MIKTTTDYKQFSLSEQNRDVDRNNRRARNLASSMLEYGWLDAFPMMVRAAGKRLIVIDGQHRFSIAMEYGIPVKYVIESQQIDVARLNDTSHSWVFEDFVKKHAKADNPEYQELIDFSSKYGISIPASAGFLANTSSPGNVTAKIKDGTYRIITRDQAYRLAECYAELCQISVVFRKVNAIKVLWACFQVSYFDPQRLVASARQRPHAVKSVTKIDLFYDLFEELYNFSRREKFPLKFDAEQAMRARSAHNPKNRER